MPDSVAEDFLASFGRPETLEPAPRKSYSELLKDKDDDNTLVALPEGSLLPSDIEVKNTIIAAAKEYNIDPALLFAIGHQESTYRPDAVGVQTPYGKAKGMFQFVDDTAKRMGIDPFDYKQAARATAKMMAGEIANGGADWAVATHYGGANPKQHGPKTRRYTKEVIAKATAIAKELGTEFKLPPEEAPSPQEAFLASFGTPAKGEAAVAATKKPATVKPNVEGDEESLVDTFKDIATRAFSEGPFELGVKPGEEASPADLVKGVGNVFLGPAARTVKRGIEGVRNALNRDTIQVARTDTELQKLYEAERKNPASATFRTNLPFEEFAKRNRVAKVSAKSSQEEEAEWSARLKANPGDAYLLPKRLAHLRPGVDDSKFAEAHTMKGIVQRFASGHKNPIDLLLQDSLPANLVTALFTLPELERKKFDQARTVASYFDTTSNPTKHSPEAVAEAQAGIDEWKKRTDPDIVESWISLWEAASSDPGAAMKMFSEAILADPYLIAAPVGLGIKPLQGLRAGKAAVDASRAMRMADKIRDTSIKVADQFIDSGTTAAGINVTVGIGQDLVTEGNINASHVRLNAALGYALGGPLGLIFMRGAKAKASNLNTARLNGTLDEFLADAAKADVAAEDIILGNWQANPYLRSLGSSLSERSPIHHATEGLPEQFSVTSREQIDRLLGITSSTDRKKAIAAYRKRVKDTFTNEEDFADYQKFVVEERLERARVFAEAAKAKEVAAKAAAEKPVIKYTADKAKLKDDYDRAIAARQSVKGAGGETEAVAEAAVADTARQLNNTEMLQAILSGDRAVASQVLSDVKAREASLKIPGSKNQKGEIDPRLLASLGISAAAATAGAAMFPDNPKKGALAGALLGGLGFAKGSRAGGIKSLLSQEGAIKPKGGNWLAGSADTIMPNVNDWTYADKITQRYLNRYAGTSDDPLKDIVLPDGDRWEDLTDQIIKKVDDPMKRDRYGEFPYRIADRLNAKTAEAFQKIHSYMDHVSDYLRTLPESEVAKMDFVRMVKETKRWDEANAKKMKSARTKSMKDMPVYKEYPDGFKWVQLTKPGEFAQESDMMGHSVRGYEPTRYKDIDPDAYLDSGQMEDRGIAQNPDWIPEAAGGHPDYGQGGWEAIKKGDAKIYSLRSPDGESHATIEVAVASNDHVFADGVRGTPYKEIMQIKGKQNAKPGSKYIPYIQDFVRSGEWATVNDLHNADIYSNGTGGYVDITGNPVDYQRGSADPKTLARVGVVAAGATIAATVFPEDQKLAGAFLGGLAGLVIPAGGTVLSRMRQAGAISLDGDIIAGMIAKGHLANKLEVEEIQVRDFEWMDQYKAGDDAGMEALYDTYQPEVARFADRFIEKRGARLGMSGEDVAQEAFIKTMQAIKDGTEIENFPAFIKSVAQRVVFDELRKLKTIKGGESATILSEEIPGTPNDYTGVMGKGRNLFEEGAGSDPFDTPENVKVRADAMDIIQQAFNSLSRDMQNVMTAIHVQNYSLDATARMLKLNRSTTQNLLFRGEAKVKEYLKNDRRKMDSQRGSVDPDTLKKLALGTAGAGIGLTLGIRNDNPVWGLGIGTVVGLILSGKVGSAVVKGADYGLGISSTRVLNHSPSIHKKVVGLFETELRETHEAFEGTNAFIKRLNSLPDDVQSVVHRALATGNPTVIHKLLNYLGDPELISGYASVRKVIDGKGVELEKLGRFQINKSREYFPRIVTDRDGLMAALAGTPTGKDDIGKIKAALREANIKSKRKNGRFLNQVEESEIINQILFTEKQKIQPDWSKNRVIEEITPELLPFYASPAESIHSYLRSVVQDINRAKFFGKYAVNMKKDGHEFLDVNKSIQVLINDELKAGTLTEAGAEEVGSILKSLFADRAPHWLVQDIKNLTYAGLLGNALSATTQLGDVIIMGAVQDWSSTIQSVVRQATGKNFVDMKDFGLADSITAEFANQRRTATLVRKVFVASLFAGVDRYGKNIALNAAIIRAKRLASTDSGQLKLARRYEAAFGDDFPKLISSLKSGKIDSLTRSYAFLELSRSQPITRFEMSQMWLDRPNEGRAVLVLKSFMLKQIDMARREGINEIKKGGAANIARGIKNLTELGIVLGIAGTSTDMIKHFLKEGVSALATGDPVEGYDLDPWDIPLNMLRTFGLTEYVKDQFFGVTKEEAQAKRDAGDKSARTTRAEPFQATIGYFTPPFNMWKDIAFKNPRMYRYLVPVVGPFVAEEMQKIDAAEREAEQDTGRGRGRPRRTR